MEDAIMKGSRNLELRHEVSLEQSTESPKRNRHHLNLVEMNKTYKNIYIKIVKTV